MKIICEEEEYTKLLYIISNGIICPFASSYCTSEDWEKSGYYEGSGENLPSFCDKCLREHLEWFDISQFKLLTKRIDDLRKGVADLHFFYGSKEEE